MADDFENEPLAVDAEDGGVIRCICGFPEDDGSTIQCDVCDVWQHFLCIDIDENNVPDEYLCDECSPRELDGDLARQRQSRRSHAEQHLRNAYAAPLPSDFEIQIKAAARTYALSEVQLDIQSLLLQEPDPPQQQQSEPFPPSNAGADRTRSQPASVAASNSRKRAAPSLNSSSSSGAGALSSGAGSASHAQPHSLEQQQQYSGPLPPVKKKRKSRQSAAGQHVAPVPAQTPTTPGLEAAQNVSASNSNNNNARRSNQVQSLPGVGAPDDEDWQESWIYEYTNIQQSIWDDLDAVEHVRVGLQSWFAHIGQPCHVHVRRIKNRPGTLPTHRLQWTRTPVPEAGSGFFAGYVEEEDFGLCAPLGPRYMNESKQQINACASRMAVKNVPSASFSLAPPLSTPFTPGNTFTAPTIACPYPRPVGQALYAKTSCAAGHFIAPFYGSVVARASYLSAPSNQYDVLGVPKPGVRALPLPWSVMIDARHFGNEVRFARRSVVSIPFPPPPPPFNRDPSDAASLDSVAVSPTLWCGPSSTAPFTSLRWRKASKLILACMLHETSPKRKRSLWLGTGMTTISSTCCLGCFSSPKSDPASHFRYTHNSWPPSPARFSRSPPAHAASAKAAPSPGCTVWPAALNLRHSGAPKAEIISMPL